MSSIDSRIVDMKFNNSEFERGIRSSLTSLEDLKKGLKLEGASKGITDVSDAAKKFSLSSMAQGIEGLASKFGALSVVALTALTNITNKAVNAGLNLVKSLSVTPVMDGLHEYETNLNSIQTVLANTGLTGQAGLNKVNGALSALNLYSDKTIYNFSEMARNIGTFTAAGVSLDVSVKAIKGIANLAAISGSSSEQASTAMYQLSQALATGTLKLIDWNSVVNAGMGGKVFQESLKDTARAHGVAVDQIIKDQGSFRDSLQKGWLTSDVLTETLSKFTGDLNASQLKTMGYNKEQIAGILEMGKTAQDAATKVKTMSQLINTLQEAAGSGWAQTWQLVFGDFGEAKVLFTGVNNVLGTMISSSAEARNKLLGDWKALGGRTALIDAIANAFHALMVVLKPIGDAFRSVFPATTGKQLYDMTIALRDFTASLKIGEDTANNLKRTFAGAFAVLDIGKTILTEAVKLFFRLFGVVTDGSGGFLKTTASIGDFLVKVDEALSKGGLLAKVFGKVGDVLEVPIRLLKAFAGAIAGAFGNVDFGSMGAGLGTFISKISSLSTLSDIVSDSWLGLLGVLDDVWFKFLDFANKIADGSGGLGEAIANGLQNVNFGDVVTAINTGLFAALVVGIKKLMNTFGGGIGGNGILDNIKASFDQLTGTLSAMQNTLRALTLLEIAAAIGILTISVVALSKIDSDGLKKALTAMTVMFTQLFASMLIFEKVSGSGGFAKMPLVTGAMILLAVAVDILASAVKKLAELDWDGLAKGLIGVTVLIGALSGAVKLMSGNTSGMITAGAGLILLAAAIKILVGAVTDLSGLNWEDLTKGLVGVGTLLGALTLFTKFAEANKGGVSQGAGLILLGVGIKILASAVKDFSESSWEDLGKGLTAISAILLAFGVFSKTAGNPVTLLASGAALVMVAAAMNVLASAVDKFGNMQWEVIGKGLLAMAGALVIIGLALYALPPTSLLSAAAILVVAASLGMIADAMKKMGDMQWDEIARGLTVLAGSLLIISVAMMAMTGALPGAAALLVVAAALTVLTPVLQALGNMTWESIAKGLLTLAGVFVIFGAAGLLLGPLVPVLIGLGAAIVLVGVGVLAAGLGVLAFAAALTALAGASAVGTAAIVGMVAAILGLIPMAMKQLGLGIIAFAQVIATGGPAITKALVTVLNSLIDAIIQLGPKIIKTLFDLLVKLLDTMADAVPKMVSSGLKMLTGILTGIRDNIEQITTVALQIITKFLDGITRGIPQIIDSGVRLIISFVNGVANAIRAHSSEMNAAGRNLASAIIEGMVNGIAGGIDAVVSAARNMALSAFNAAKLALKINSPSKMFAKLGSGSGEGYVDGLESYRDVVTGAAASVGSDAILAMAKSISGLSDLVANDLDLTPTITPVIDLTSAQRQAVELNSMLSGKSIDIGSSFSAATSASRGIDRNNATQDGTQQTTTSGDVTFIQNNNSPKALSASEIYRQTRNQLSVAKGALA